ncbi:hypothetical protein AB0J83_23945 [Actinoplanes sp. NPDC049596]|uniref:hypothetical protein n=1 Tax=unclassified Actinoplanes TaxID=2626549 RepID=UPI003442789F
MRSADMAHQIQRWAEEGLVTTEQAERMRAGLPGGASRRSLVSEGLGYLGGSLVTVALIVLSSHYWTELGTAGRLIVIGAAGLVLTGAGVITPGRAGAAAARLRAVLWLAAVVTAFAWMLIAGRDLLDLGFDGAFAVAAAGALACAGTFWAAHHHPVQHAGAWLPWLVLAGALVALGLDEDLLPWAGIWAARLAWGLLAWGDLLRPAALGRALGALAAVAGAVVLAGAGWHAMLSMGTVIGLVVFAVARHDLAVLVTAAIGSLFIVPAVTTAYFPGSVATAFATLIAGAVLIGAAVALARRRTPLRPRELPELSAGRAVSAAAVVLMLAAAGILLAAT